MRGQRSRSRCWSVAHPEEPSDVQALRMMNLIWKGLESLQQGDVWLPAEWRPR